MRKIILHVILAIFIVLGGNISMTETVDAYYPCHFDWPGETGNCEGCQSLSPTECHTYCTPTFFGYSCYTYLQQKQNNNQTCTERFLYSLIGTRTSYLDCSSPTPSPTPNPTPQPAIQPCSPTVTGMVDITLYVQCMCPDGTEVSSNNGISDCVGHGRVVCWDGSSATNESQCPQYKYCPSDYYTKRPLSYSCVQQTQLCSDGSSIPVYESCRTIQYQCPYDTFWNGSWCQRTVYFLPYYDTTNTTFGNSYGTTYGDDYWYSNMSYVYGW